MARSSDRKSNNWKAMLPQDWDAFGNEHLLSLLFSPNFQMRPSTVAVVNSLLDYVNVTVLVQMPSYFYNTWVGCCLVLANKVNPADLPPGTILPDYHPVNIGGEER